VFVIGITGLVLDWGVGKIQELVTHRAVNNQ
jgi:nitrate/nitrite transport system permease protein